MGFEVFLTAIVTGCHYRHFIFVAGGVAFPLEIDVADDGLPLADPNDNCCPLGLTYNWVQVFGSGAVAFA